MRRRDAGDASVSEAGVMPVFSPHSFTLLRMKNTSKTVWNPERLDMRAFAQATAILEATEPLSTFERLFAEAVLEGVASPSLVRWQAQGNGFARCRALRATARPQQSLGHRLAVDLGQHFARRTRATEIFGSPFRTVRIRSNSLCLSPGFHSGALLDCSPSED